VTRFQSSEEVHQAWTDGLVSPLDYLTNIRPFLTPGEIDGITARMPSRVLTLFHRFADKWVQCDSEIVEIGQGEVYPDPPEFTSTLASWLERNKAEWY
jgi:hypothetical protein